MKSIQYIFIVSAILISASCAHIVPPTGGIKDIIPPKMVKAIPDTLSTHFNAPQIKIEFDEFIQLKDELSQIVISPPLEKQPDIKVQKKSLIIKFKEKLKDNTTYNINFGNSISDTHEGNIKEGFQYVFSTGDYVDSLTLSGRCKYAKDLKTDKGILIMLYKDFNDSVPTLHKPDYFAKTDSTGNYKINNIKQGTYKLFALKDLNNNYLFDQPAEAIGLVEKPIQINGKDTANLFLFEEVKAKQYLVKSFCEEFGKMVFILNKPTIDVGFKITNNPAKDTAVSFFEYSIARDTIIYWFTSFPQDSMKIIVSDNAKNMDTLSIHIKPKEQKKNRDKVVKFMLNINSLPNSGQSLSPEGDLQLVCSHPIVDFDSTKFRMKEDTLPIKNFKVSGLDSTKRKLVIKYPWKEGANYSLTILKGTFKDIFGLTNDTLIIFNTKIKSAKDYGSMRLKFKAPKNGTNYILQLLNDRDEVCQQHIISGDTVLNYNFLDPQKYKLKLVFDANNNGKWDTGDYFRHLHPERITYCKEIFNIRANWDVEANWTLGVVE